MGLDIFLKNNDDVESVHMSHTGIHRLRDFAIRATIFYLENMKKEELESAQPTKKRKVDEEGEDEEIPEEVEHIQELIDELRGWTKEPEKDSLDGANPTMGFQAFLQMIQRSLAVQYTNIPKYHELSENFFELNLAGLHKFTIFSDVSGTYTYGDCYDIFQTFQLIYPFLQNVEDQEKERNPEEEDVYVKDFFDEIYNLFKVAVETKGSIGFSG